MSEYMTSLGLILCIFVLPAILIYSYIRPAKFNIRSAKNPTGGNSRAAFSAGMVREVAAEMNAESDAKAIIVVGDDGVIEAVRVGINH